VSRPRRIAPVLPAALVAVLALLLPLLGSSQGGVAVFVSAGSVTAKAAQRDATPADARFPVDGPLFAEARRIATAHWGTDACKGQIAVGWQPLEPGTNATAAWRNPTDAWNNAAENFDCSVTLNTQAEFDFAKLCTVLTHEVGHLVGRQHAAAEGDLMSAVYSSPLPACTQAAPPQEEESADGLGAEDEGADEAEAAAAAKPAKATRKAATKTSSKRSLRKTRTKTKCVRRFSDGRRTKRCARGATQAKRASKRH
jgi:hypothetical protein